MDYAVKEGGDLRLFYADPVVRGYYKQWISYIVNRKNTVTGQRYVDDPTIFACELPVCVKACLQQPSPQFSQTRVPARSLNA